MADVAPAPAVVELPAQNLTKKGATCTVTFAAVAGQPATGKVKDGKAVTFRVIVPPPSLVRRPERSHRCAGFLRFASGAY